MTHFSKSVSAWTLQDIPSACYLEKIVQIFLIISNWCLRPSPAYYAQYLTINWNCGRLWKMLDPILLVMLFQTSHFKTYHNSYMCSFAKMYMHNVHCTCTWSWQLSKLKESRNFSAMVRVFAFSNLRSQMCQNLWEKEHLCVWPIWPFWSPLQARLTSAAKLVNYFHGIWKLDFPRPRICSQNIIHKCPPFCFSFLLSWKLSQNI